MDKAKECKHCGKYMYHNEARRFHEKACAYNPQRAVCTNCVYAEIYDVQYKYRIYKHLSCASETDTCVYTSIDASQKVKDAREELRQELLGIDNGD